MILGIYLGSFGMFTLLPSIAVIIISIALVLVFRKPLMGAGKLSLPPLFFIAILAIFLVSIIALSYPDFIFPLTCSDVYNHARAIRIDAFAGGFEVLQSSAQSPSQIFAPHAYPIGFYALAVPLSFIFGDAYSIITFLELIIFALLICGAYAVSILAGFNRTASIIASFFTAFSITSLWILEQGFLPQLLGSLFLLGAVYFFMKKRKIPFILSSAGLIVYPPLFGLEIIFLILAFVLPKLCALCTKKFRYADILKISSINSKDALIYFVLALASLILVFPEAISLILQYSSVSFAKDNLFLIRGGIFTPNLFGLLPFVLALAGLYFIFKEKVKKMKAQKTNILFSPLIILILSSALASAIIVAVYVINILAHFSFKTELTALYQAVKFFYFLLIPAGIIAGFGFAKLISSKKLLPRVVAGALIAFMLIYFFCYFPIILSNDTEPAGYYSVAAFTANLPIGSKLGIDNCLLISKDLTQPFPYQSLIDRPNAPGPNLCRQTEATRDFQFPWASYRYENGRFRIYDDSNKEVLLLGDEVNLNVPNIDYFLTDCRELNSPIVYQNLGVKLYKIS